MPLLISTPRPRRHGRKLRAFAVCAAAVGALAVAPTAAAHELGLVLVVGPGGGSRSDNAEDGFRLAVDRSPDISHPPGQEAGDHLGGIDVDVRIVRSTPGGGDVARRIARSVAAGSRIVVVLPPVPPTSPIVSVAPLRDVLVVVPRRVATRARSLVVLTGQPRGAGDPARRAAFERAFERRFGRAPGARARAGYDTGRLLDSLLGSLGEGPFSGPALDAAVARARRALVASSATVVRPATASMRVPAMEADGRRAARTLLVSGAALVLTGSASTLRSRHPNDRRPGRTPPGR